MQRFSEKTFNQARLPPELRQSYNELFEQIEEILCIYNDQERVVSKEQYAKLFGFGYIVATVYIGCFMPKDTLDYAKDEVLTSCLNDLEKTLQKRYQIRELQGFIRCLVKRSLSRELRKKTEESYELLKESEKACEKNFRLIEIETLYIGSLIDALRRRKILSPKEYKIYSLLMSGMDKTKIAKKEALSKYKLQKQYIKPIQEKLLVYLYSEKTISEDEMAKIMKSQEALLALRSVNQNLKRLEELKALLAIVTKNKIDECILTVRYQQEDGTLSKESARLILEEGGGSQELSDGLRSYQKRIIKQIKAECKKHSIGLDEEETALLEEKVQSPEKIEK